MKMAFDYVDKHVDKLYAKQIDTTSESEVNALIMHIKDFINACGWTEEEYLHALHGYSYHKSMN